MGNIDFRKIQISGPAMNFVLEPQNFSGKNWNSPINTGPALLFTAITYSVNSFALFAPSDATLAGSSATEIQFKRRGELDGALFDHDPRQPRRSAEQLQQQSDHRQFPAAPFRHPRSGPPDHRGAGAIQRRRHRHQ